MSRLDGHVEFEHCDEALLSSLVEILIRIHAFLPADDWRPREYEPWTTPMTGSCRHGRKTPNSGSVPSRCPPSPSHRHTAACFCTATSTSGTFSGQAATSAALSTGSRPVGGRRTKTRAHASTSLAMLHGVAAADAFEGAYYAAADRSFDDGDRYWNFMDIVGFLPDPCKVVQPWRDHGVEISDETAHARLEVHLRRCLDG